MILNQHKTSPFVRKVKKKAKTNKNKSKLISL